MAHTLPSLRIPLRQATRIKNQPQFTSTCYHQLLYTPIHKPVLPHRQGDFLYTYYTGGGLATKRHRDVFATM